MNLVLYLVSCMNLESILPIAVYVNTIFIPQDNLTGNF